MYLSKLTYKDSDWEIGPICLSEQSLIVGPNATGKSTVLRCIRRFIRVVVGNIKIDAALDFRYDMEFSNSIGVVSYILRVQGGRVVEELLETNGKARVRRDVGGSIVGDESVNVPDTTLLINARRDIDKYPDIEMVLTWVEQMSSFIFSNILSSDSRVSPFTASQIDICRMWEKIDTSQKEAVKKWMQKLRYNIDIIDIDVNKLGEKTLYVVEENVTKPIVMGKMSNGMYRVLYLLVYLYYVSVNSSGTVLVDDLGEGLDYFRSSTLGEMLFSFSKEHNIQLIVTSNDNFLVDKVDLSAWVLLKREGHTVSSISEKTNPEDFARFRKLGLRNFDLLKTDFLVRYFD